MNGWPIDRPITSTGITLYPLLMSISNDTIEQDQEKKDQFVKILKLCKKMKPNLLSTDNFGRTSLHHAAAAGNSVAI